jgi:hypothetical protein
MALRIEKAFGVKMDTLLRNFARNSSRNTLRLLESLPAPYSEAMEVHFARELQAKIDQLVIDSGCPVEELSEDAL